MRFTGRVRLKVKGPVNLGNGVAPFDRSPARLFDSSTLRGAVGGILWKV